MYAQITALYGQTQIAVFPVFAGYELHITEFRFDGVQTGVLTGAVALREYQLTEASRVIHAIPFNGSLAYNLTWAKGHKVLSEKTLVLVELSSISAGTPIIGASFDGDLYRKT